MKNFIGKYTKSLLGSQFRRNVTISSILFGINSALIFISYPVYLNYIGIKLFSVWSLLATIISFAEIGKFGIGDAIVKYIAEDSIKENIIKKKEIFSSGFLIILFSSSTIATILYFARYQIASILNIPNYIYNEVILIIPLFGLIVFLYLFNDLLKAFLTGIGRLDLSNIIFIGSNISKLIFAIIFFQFDLKLFALLYSVIISSLLSTILFILILGSKLGYKLLIPTKYNISTIKKVTKYGASLLGTQLLNMGMLPLIKIVLSNTANITSVGYFEIAVKVLYTIRGFFQKGLYALLPKISNLAAGKDSNQIVVLLNKFNRILLFTSIPILILLAVFSPYWMELWLTDNYNIEIVICYNIIQVGMFSSLIALPSYYTLLGLGNEKSILIEAIIRVLLNLFLVLIILLVGLSNYYIYISFAASTMVSNLYLILRRIELLHN